MSTRLVILGILHRHNLHGYEIKHEIEEHMGDWTNIAFGSIYFALGKLAEEGLIENVATEQEGSRPSRFVYAITPAGREEFRSLLHQLWQQDTQTFYDFDIALYFKDYLTREEQLAYLQQRIDFVRGSIEHIDQHYEETIRNPYVPPFARALFDHSRVHQQAELDWLKALHRDIEQGLYKPLW